MKKWDEEKKLIKQIQKCQRNYDYSKWDSDDVHYQQIKDHLLISFDCNQGN